MSGKKNVETSEIVAPSTVSGSSVKLPEKDMGKEISSNPVSSTTSSVGNATSGFKGVGNQPAASDHSVYYPPSFDYYPGYGDKAHVNNSSASYAGMPSDNGSMMYYYPGYTPYTTEYMSVDGKQAYASSDYSYGSESFPQYSYDPNYTGNGTTGVGTVKTAMGPHGTGKPNGFRDAKTNNNVSRKATVPPLNSRSHHSSNFSRPVYQNQQFNHLNKLGSNFQSTNLMKGFQPAGRYSSYTNRNPNAFTQYSPVNYQSNGRVWNNNHRYKSRDNFGKNGETEGLNELTRGPRGDNKNKTTIKSDGSDNQGLTVEKDKYNSEDFQTEYENAKFFVIKSFSEDDVHKCVKYDVWSSTHNGNLKLDAAFRDAAESSETGTRCPVFLFFSVNGSGQFVGVAEMIGQVDYSKTMDFWQLDKWNGFFPVKWHIIKDVPNTLLRHIILENNENRAVTYSRDTQEILLKQGLEMLSIFKSYSEKNSVLDDYNFYENREKSLKMKRASKKASQNNDSENCGFENFLDARGGGIRGEQAVETNEADTSSLVSLTKNLSLNSQPLQSSST